MTGPQKKNPLGPTGRTVADNIRRLRGDMQYIKLATILEKLGRPIPTLGLRKIESYERRVDADDLAALAVALGVSPATLLMPAATDAGTFVEMTGLRNPVLAGRAWDWLTARDTLEPEYSDTLLAFFQRALPAWEQGSVAEQYRQLFIRQTRDGAMAETLDQDRRHGDD